jgi:hypothetical protein
MRLFLVRTGWAGIEPCETDIDPTARRACS